MNKFISTGVRVVLPLLIGALVLWLLYRDTDFSKLLDTLRSDANFFIIAFSLLWGLIANTIRGLRWHILIKGTGERPRVINSVLATHGNYAVNMALPRMGEVWRCGVMAHYSGIGFSKLLGTLLVDRASDFVIVSALAGVMALINIAFFQQFFSNNPTLLHTIESLLTSWIPYALLLLIILGGIFVIKYQRDNPLIQKGLNVLSNVWQGLKSIATLEQKWLFVLYSVLLWVGYFLFFYTTFYAFSFTQDLGVTIGFIAFVMSSIGVVAPVQAGVGAWHFMVIYTLTAFGVARDDAGNFALIVHTIQTLFTTLCGLAGMMLLPLVNKRS